MLIYLILLIKAIKSIVSIKKRIIQTIIHFNYLKPNTNIVNLIITQNNQIKFNQVFEIEL